MARKPSKPRDKTAVGRSPHVDEITDRFVSGWTATAVLDYLQWLWPTEKHPSRASLDRWRKTKMPATALVPHNLVQARLKNVDVKVDLLGSLSRLVYLLQERVFGAMEIEATLTQGVPVQATDRAVQTYLEALRDWRSVAEDLGLLPKRARPSLTLIGNQNNLVVDPEVAKELADYAREFREVQARRVLELGDGSNRDEEEP